MTTSWIETYTGERFSPLSANPGNIRIEDIAHSLSMQCRFAGHCVRHYSVAEHSVLAAHRAADRGLSVGLQLRALLHDAAEAYLVDVPRPVKRHLGIYKSFEDHLSGLIYERFRATETSPLIKEIDNELLASEGRALMHSGGEDWGIPGPGPVPWIVERIRKTEPTPAESKIQYLDLFHKLSTRLLEDHVIPAST